MWNAWVWGTWDHDEECPQDDTCECAVVAAVNRALEGYDG